MSQFSWVIPDASLVPSSTSSASTGVVTIDHVGDGLSRLQEQWKSSANIITLFTIFLQRFNDLETMLQALYSLRNVYTANADAPASTVGAQLDMVGDLVGQPRNGLTNDDYRRYIFARVATNNSDGVIEDLIKICKLVLNDATTTIDVETLGIATCEVSVYGNIVSDNVAGILISFLRQAHAGGVRLALRTQPVLDAVSFFTALTSFSTSARSIGDTVIPVDSTHGFPTAGSLVVEPGGAHQETVTYANIDATHFLNCSALTQTHVITTRVDASTQSGLGLGSSADAGQPTLLPYQNVGTTGGQLADARE